jgi:hypothetical protein
MPKPKGKLDSLEEQDHTKLVNWLLAGMTYEKAVGVVSLELGIETSVRALHEFWDTYCEPLYLERRRGAARLSSVIRKEAQASPEDFDAATVDLMSRLSFELANRPATNANAQSRLIKDVKTLFTLVLKKRSQESKDKSLDFEKEKFRAGMMKKIELGLEELYAQIKDNPTALEAFARMKEAIAAK